MTKEEKINLLMACAKAFGVKTEDIKIDEEYLEPFCNILKDSFDTYVFCTKFTNKEDLQKAIAEKLGLELNDNDDIAEGDVSHYA